MNSFWNYFSEIHSISVELDLHVLFTAVFRLGNDLHQLKFCHAYPPDFNLSNLLYLLNFYRKA